MKLRTVRVLRRAERDLQSIYDRAAREAGHHADSFIDELLGTIENLDTMSERGARPHDPVLRRKGYRFLVHGRYLVFYKASHSRVTVYRVVAGNREFRSLL